MANKKIKRSTIDIIIILSLTFILCLYMTVGNSYSSTITFNDMSGFNVDYTRDGTNVVAFAGEKNITYEDFASAAYCVEPGIPYSNGEVVLTNPSDYNAFERAWTQQATYNNYYNGIYAAWLMDQYSTGLGYSDYVSDKDVVDAGLQLAIWQVLFNFNPNDSSLDDTYFHNFTYRNNNSYFVPSIFSEDLSDGPNAGQYGDGNKEEQAWRVAYEYMFDFQSKHANDNINFSGKYEFFIAEISDENGRYQSHIIAKPVPAPATLILLSTGLLALTWMGRRREVDE